MSKLMEIDEQFDKIAQETIRKAAEVKCSQQEYAEGLQQIAEELLSVADAAENCAKQTD